MIHSFVVDFNEMVEKDLVLLSQQHERADIEGDVVPLVEGMLVRVCELDKDEAGGNDWLVADGRVEASVVGGWSGRAKWCCRLDARGIRHAGGRHDTDV